jgi:hypothetical protein
MAVLAIKTEPKCKLCQHSHRPEIDLLLEKRSKGEVDADGNKVNEEYVLAKLTEWGVVNPNKANLTGHFKRHCEVVTDDEAAQVQQELSELNQQMLAAMDESDGSIDGDLRAIFKIGMKRIRGRILQGQDPGITLDHALKSSAELTKRSHNEAQRELLGTLGAGLAQALMAPVRPRQIEPAGEVVIDQEPVEA